MGFFRGLLKYIIFLFNFAFVIIALAFIVLGAIFKLDFDKEIFDDSDLKFDVAPILLIVVGCFIFVIAFFGCCGAIKKNSCMLTTYGIILVAILVFQVAIGIYALVYHNKEDLKDTLFKTMKNKMDLYGKNEVVTEWFDSIQKNMKCCGVYGASDWNNPPDSCKNDGILYSEGCGPKIYDLLKNNVKTVGIVAIVLGAVELIGAISAFILANGHKRGYYD